MAGTRLQGRVALITGAASGIGQGIAELFAAQGAKVALMDIDGQGATKTAARIRSDGGYALVLHGDVASEDDVIRAAACTVEAYGALHHLVNNAGIVLVKALEECAEAEWDRVMAVNVKSIFLTVKHSLHWLKLVDGATIVNMASVSSFVGQSNTASYVASKGAVMMLTSSRSGLLPDTASA